MSLSGTAKEFILFKSLDSKFCKITISRGNEKNVKFANFLFLGILDLKKIVTNRYGKIRHFYKSLVKFLLLMSLFVGNKKGGERQLEITS
jgi:hypothetical protein